MTPPVWAWAVVLALVLLGLAYRLVPGMFYRAFMRVERRLAGLATRELTLSNGMRIVYNDGGSGEPLLLLHGFTADKDNWTRVARPLKGQLRVIAPDLPGFGESSRETTRDYSIKNQLLWLEDLVASLRLERFHLGGSSMGGALAAHYAVRHPRQVRSLWLLAPAGVATGERSDMEQILAHGDPHPLIPQNPEQFEKTLDFVFARRPFIPGAVQRYLARVAAVRAPLHLKIFSDLIDDEAMQFRPLLNPVVDGLRTPALVVWGSLDRVLHPAGAVELQKLMPAAELRLNPGLGHLPMLEAPRQTAADYLAFVATRAGD